MAGSLVTWDPPGAQLILRGNCIETGNWHVQIQTNTAIKIVKQDLHSIQPHQSVPISWPPTPLSFLLASLFITRCQKALPWYFWKSLRQQCL